MNNRTVLWIIGLSMVAGLFMHASARTIYVAEPGQGGHVLPYTNWVDAATNIQDAVNEAGEGDTVLISNGTYNLTAQIVVAGSKNNIAIRGVSGNAADVIVNANNYPGKPVTNRCMIINGNNILIEALTFSEGRALGASWDGYGGGLLVQHLNNTSVVNNCRFTDNVAGIHGGGIALTHGTVMLSDCEVSRNVSSNSGGGLYVYRLLAPGLLMDGGTIASNRAVNLGGGIYIGGDVAYEPEHFRFINLNIHDNEAVVSGGGVYCDYSGHFRNMFFSGNTATNNGGGLYFYYGGVVVDSEIIGNVSITNGGGVYCDYGGMVMGSSLISNNAGLRGGGAYCNSGGFVAHNDLRDNNAYQGAGVYSFYGGIIRGNLIVGNTAINNGGGVMQWQWTHTAVTSMLESCTIVSNTAGGAGGGLWLRDDSPYTVSNCNNIIWHNQAATHDDVYNNTVLASNAFYHCAIPSTPAVTTGQGNITDNPEFINWVAGDFRVRADSPCINTGAYRAWMDEPGARDLDGRSRIDRFTGLVDIGCYERAASGTMIQVR